MLGIAWARVGAVPQDCLAFDVPSSLLSVEGSGFFFDHFDRLADALPVFLSREMRPAAELGKFCGDLFLEIDGPIPASAPLLAGCSTPSSIPNPPTGQSTKSCGI